MVTGITEYGKQIKKALLDMDKDQMWLISEIKAKTGMYMDSSYLWKIMTGKEKSPVMIKTINDILNIQRV